MRYWLLVLVFTALTGLAGCAPQPAFTPTPTKTPNPVSEQTPAGPTITDTPTPPAPTADPTAEGYPTPEPDDPEATQPASGSPAQIASPGADSTPDETAPDINAGLPAEHYWMQRPIPSGHRDYLDRTYPYGGTAGGRLRPHTGVEFFNPEGTPVVAVANAVVYYAGTDQEVLYAPQPDFYGNLIVLQLSDAAYKGQPVFALYGHLSRIGVETGQTVSAGEVIGAVGGTGIASGGAHLHFEVRIGNPLGYATSTRNPDLWIRPYAGYGTLAGRVVDASGAHLREVSLTIRGDDMVRYTWTYAGDENIPDDEWRENFTYGDLPQGWYTITTRSDRRLYSERVYIYAGRTTLLELVFD